MLDGYEIALVALEGCFITICCIYCYGTEIWLKTPWPDVWRGLRATLRPHKSRISMNFLHVPRREKSQPTGLVENDEADAENQHLPVSATATKAMAPKRKEFSRSLTRYPFCLWMLAVAPALAQHFGTHTKASAVLLGSNEDSTPRAELKFDADICGVGVRVGLYIPIGLILYTISMGLVWREEAGAKELGGTQLLSKLFIVHHSLTTAADLAQICYI